MLQMIILIYDVFQILPIYNIPFTNYWYYTVKQPRNINKYDNYLAAMHSFYITHKSLHLISSKLDFMLEW